MGLSVAGAVFLGVSTAATLYSADQQNKAARETNRANERREQLEQKRANIRVARERAKVIRQQRIARAQAVASSTSGAGGASSGLSGILGNIQGQGGSNIQFLNQNQSISDTITKLNISSGRRIAKHQTRAGIGRAAASVGSSGADIFT